MATLASHIVELLKESPGLTDREITDSIRGAGKPQQPINQTARSLEVKGILTRTRRADGLIGNYLTHSDVPPPDHRLSPKVNHDVEALSEDELKRVLVNSLEQDNWSCAVAWGRVTDIDIDARRGDERWIIEVKGPGSRPQMRVNYFLGILGETLQRMDDPNAQYSIALPDLPQYRRLWDKLPALAKSRTTISVIFVSNTAEITQGH